VAALGEAARLANGIGATLHVAHVVTADEVERAQELVDTPTDEMLANLRRHLGEMVDGAPGGRPVAVEIHVVIGHPFGAMVDLARSVGAELMVLGSFGSSGKRDKVGLVAARCVRKAEVPVLLVREAQEGAFRKIAACTDFSDASAEAVRVALDLAGREGASVVVLHSADLQWVPASGLLYDVAPLLDPQAIESQRQGLKDRLAAFCKKIDPAGRAETVLLEGANAAYTIATYLEKEKIDLAVVGTRGKTGLKEILLGTTAERLVHESPCSVLAVKA
jgi:nucleotide-binding universal stress UspA family protein